LKKETKYIVALAVLLILFVVVQLLVPKSLDWTPTFLASDRNPFGAFVSRRVLDSFFEGNEVKTNNLTFYELQDSIRTGENVMSISTRFAPDPEDVNVLLNKVNNGSHAFISASSFRGKFADTLGLFSNDVYFGGLVVPGTHDTSDLKFVASSLRQSNYYYRLENVSYYFSAMDSIKHQAFVVSTNAWGKPVTIRVPWGKGYFVLNTTPLAFTNNYLLYEKNHRYASETLSFLPTTKTWWTSYYQIGRMESETPLRFILNTEPLRWAYYIMVMSLLIFLLFESKRKQRIIPIVRPLANTTLEFVKTIANMYLHAGDHKAIAEKKIVFFLDQVRSNYYLSGETGEAMIERVAKKSGNSLETTQRLFALIKMIQSTSQINQQTLLDLNHQIDEFFNLRLNPQISH
jgi:hypothetical protein